MNYYGPWARRLTKYKHWFLIEKPLNAEELTEDENLFRLEQY